MDPNHSVSPAYRIAAHPYVQRGLYYAQVYGQRALDLAKNLLQRGGACYKGEGGVIMLGRFQEYKAGLETLAKRYGARILDKPFPKGVQLADALRAEIDAAERIYFRVVGVEPGKISFDIELKYILSKPELYNKTKFIVD
jgi:hypothetical protein